MKISLALFRTLPIIKNNMVTIIINNITVKLSISKNTVIDNNFKSSDYAILIDWKYTPCIVHSDFETFADLQAYREYKVGNCVSTIKVDTTSTFRDILNKRHKIGKIDNIRAFKVIKLVNQFMDMLTTDPILLKRVTMFEIGDMVEGINNDTFVIVKIEGDIVTFCNTRTNNISQYSLELLLQA